MLMYVRVTRLGDYAYYNFNLAVRNLQYSVKSGYLFALYVSNWQAERQQESIDALERREILELGEMY